ncbi:hypothetical protein TNCV_4135281 [Trichonephila clavipes]|nr:hypothetical protein TNCV_4135281 [Trichonephila clavipes]
MSRQHVAKLCHYFQSAGRTMTVRGRQISSTTKITTARIGEMIQNARWVALREISSEMGLIYGSVKDIISDGLGYSKPVL